jgi:hypothetical protein
VLLFVDETWQEVAGTEIGALGAVAIAESEYNHFARQVFSMKRDVLSASELMEKEIKGKNCFAKAQFRRRGDGRDDCWLQAGEQLLTILEAHDARAFVIWTAHPELLTLRIPPTYQLTKPYKQLIHDVKAFMQREAPNDLASVNFDQRGNREDAGAACAISNYFYRTQGGWHQRFIQVPNFTVSALSPGLQAADVVAYLGAQVSDPAARPELQAYVQRLQALGYTFTRGNRLRRCIRRVGGLADGAAA